MPSLFDALSPARSSAIPSASSGLPSFRTRLLALAQEHETLEAQNEALLAHSQGAAARISLDGVDNRLSYGGYPSGSSSKLSVKPLDEVDETGVACLVPQDGEVGAVAPGTASTSVVLAASTSLQVQVAEDEFRPEGSGGDIQKSVGTGGSHSQETRKTRRSGMGSSNYQSGNFELCSTYNSDTTAVLAMLPGFMSPRRKRAGSPDALLARMAGDGDDLDKVDCWVFFPAGFLRIVLDIVIFCGWLFELWAVPFELIFCDSSAIPGTIDTLFHIALGSFLLDLLVNFNTGFYAKGTLVMNRRRIAFKYVKMWFWVDLIATLPLEQFKPLRLLHIGRILRLRRTWAVYRSISWMSNYHTVTTLFKVLFFNVVLVHIHACIWALIQSSSCSTFESAARWYVDAFYWAYAALTVGALTPIDQSLVPHMRPLGLCLLELLVASERVAFLVVIIVWCVCQAQLNLHNRIKLRKRKHDVMQYLKRRRVSLDTRVELLFGFNEINKVHGLQQRFQDFLESELPEDVKQKIAWELWSERLRSHALIEEVHKLQQDFLPELVMIVCEEVFASKTIVFHSGDASVASYFILHGSLVSPTNMDLPEFTTNNWIGETALVNPLLKRRMTMMTTKISELMAVPAEGFHSLLNRHNLRRQFEYICQQNLWKGLCGRCGALGDHNTDECPFFTTTVKLTRESLGEDDPNHSQFSNRDSLKSRSNFFDFFGRDTMTSVNSNGGSANASLSRPISRELQQFLTVNHLDRLIAKISNLGIHDLDEMMNAVEPINEQLDLGGEDHLSSTELRALSSQHVHDFRQIASKTVQRLLFARPSSHFIFLSHSKKEAGTEAALMQRELELLIADDKEILGPHQFEVPIFLDSENLNNLKDLQAAVNNTHNLVVLLTREVLTRPWVLVEIVTAIRGGIKVIPVQVTKPDAAFVFPGQEFYDRMRSHDFLPSDGEQVLSEAGISIAEVESCIRKMFQQIALPYSPHRSIDIRDAELKAVLKRCRMRATDYAEG